MKLAAPSNRFLAQIVDTLVVYALLFLVLILTSGIALVLGIGGQGQPPSDNAAVALGLFAILLAGGYYFFADALPGGQSLGKRFMGIAVIDQDTLEPCSPGQAFVRNLLTLLGILDWIFIFGSRRQRLGDKAARTLVVAVVPEAEVDGW